jgi:hypothetical protein
MAVAAGRASPGRNPTSARRRHGRAKVVLSIDTWVSRPNERCGRRLGHIRRLVRMYGRAVIVPS